MTTDKEPDPIWDPGDVRKLQNPLAYMTVMDLQIASQSHTVPLIMPANKYEVFPAPINLLEVHDNALETAGLMGIRTHIQSVRKGREPAHKTPQGDAVRVNYEGRMGEAVISLTTNRFAEYATDDFGQYCDINGDEVKTRGDNPKFMDLLLDRNKIDPCRIYWLVIGEFPKYKNMGWTTGATMLDEKLGWGRPVNLGPRGWSFGIHCSNLYKWMPDFDPYYYIKAHASQRQLDFGGGATGSSNVFEVKEETKPVEEIQPG